jgi:hypothetical protein
MSAEKYPRGWNKAGVQRVIDYYESQTDEEVAAEIKAGLNSTTMEVPRALVPTIRELIANRKSSRTKKTHKTTLPAAKRAPGKSKLRKSSPRGSRLNVRRLEPNECRTPHASGSRTGS